MPIFQNLRLILLLLAWLAALFQIIFGEAVTSLSNTAVVLYLIYLLITLPLIKRGSVIIIGFLGLIGVLTIHEISQDVIFDAGRFVLIFAGLVPTMILAKSTASTMPSVVKTQERLAALPPEHSSAGLQIAGHAFGGVINTGTFAMLSAALPPSSSKERRQIAAMAALRGMNASAVWSPFFVAFAIGQSYIEPAASWWAIAVGVVMALLFNGVTLPIFTKGLNFKILMASLNCLQPVAIRLLVVLASVLAVALIFNFTALSAVVATMPLLVLLQFWRQPQNVKTIINLTTVSLKGISDDIVVISSAMILGFMVTRTDGIATILTWISADTFPAYIALTITPVAMMLASVVGIHPVISSTVLLSLFSGAGSDAAPFLLMQAHLLGWATGTMSSIASLSVITCSTLYRVSGRDLAMGANMITAFGYALMGGILLSLANMFFT